MPKIIKDVEKTIRNSAVELFIEHSYTDVDMKMISKKSGVAVGTLYNYYGNKKQLYLSILKESWQNTFNKLDVISELAISSREKLRKFISTLYEDIQERNGLGKILINTSADELKEDKEIKDLKGILILKVENFLYNLDKVDNLSICSNINTKLTESLLITTLVMYELHPKDKEENITFLVEFIGLSIK
ncbi:TetR/AcrR family transcriptional regulator [Candidatus Clostridium radicumherbarum]|uniref:TetR/AcrR family transcriptional regulator n=1 Tax=Candidatus Clostridium radicumherbarum TaxID=3381662 RepID=A0ABW8TPK1_9CLOT